METRRNAPSGVSNRQLGEVRVLSLALSSSYDETTVETFTDREREVLQRTTEGYTSKQIGDKLQISHRTVKKHRERIKEKLEVQNAVEMAAVALRRGLIPGPSLS